VEEVKRRYSRTVVDVWCGVDSEYHASYDAGSTHYNSYTIEKDEFMIRFHESHESLAAHKKKEVEIIVEDSVIGNDDVADNKIPMMWSITSIGNTAEDSNHGAVNWKSRDSILFHFNPRPNEREIVMNSLLNESWGAEERIPLPPESINGPLTAGVYIDAAGYHIFLNGSTVEKHLFKHRADFLHFVSLEPKFYLARQMSINSFQCDDYEPVNLSAPDSKSNLLILQASYGAKNTSNDYTASLRAHVQGRNPFKHTGGIHLLLGDPNLGEAKTFQVTFVGLPGPQADALKSGGSWGLFKLFRGGNLNDGTNAIVKDDIELGGRQ
jgi:hypothetical protein